MSNWSASSLGLIKVDQLFLDCLRVCRGENQTGGHAV